MQEIHVYGLPDLAQAEAMRGTLAVVIDVLRATTTLVTAVNSGAKCVVPVREVDDVFALKEKMLRGEDSRFPKPPSASELLLGGERWGVRIAGFDLGNSPSEYIAGTVADKTILFSTTNGTRAIDRAKQAQAIFPAAFLNVRALATCLVSRSAVSPNESARTPISIVCAGTDGTFTAEDLLLAGCIVQELQFQLENRITPDAQAMSVLELWNETYPLKKRLKDEPLAPETLAKALRASAGGQNLRKIGLDADIRDASRMNSLDVIAEIDPSEMICVLKQSIA